MPKIKYLRVGRVRIAGLKSKDMLKFHSESYEHLEHINKCIEGVIDDITLLPEDVYIYAHCGMTAKEFYTATEEELEPVFWHPLEDCDGITDVYPDCTRF